MLVARAAREATPDSNPIDSEPDTVTAAAAAPPPSGRGIGRGARVLRNVVTNYLRFFVSGFVGFILTPIMVSTLGDAGYGLWVAVFSLTGYFGLLDQGIRPSMVRYVSRDHALGDREELGRTISSATAMYSAIGILVLIATLVAAVAFVPLFRVSGESAAVARQLVLLSGLSVAISFPFGVFGAVLSGLQRYDIGNAIGISIAVLRIGAFIAVLRMGGGLVGLAWASLILNVVGHAASWVFVRRLLPHVPLGRRYVNRSHLKRIVSYSSVAFVGALANSLAFQTDALVVTALIGAAAVTPFALAAGLIDNVRSLVYSATWVLAPTASELETLGESEKLHHMMIAGSKYSVLVSWPVLAGLMIFGSNFLTTWVGERFADVGSVLIIILAVPTLIALPQAATGAVLFGVSRHTGVVALSLLNAVVNLVLSILMARPYGLIGVALGTAIPLFVISGVITLVYGCRSLGLPVGRYVREGMIQPGLLTLVFVATALAGQALWHPIGWLPLLAVTGSCWVVFAACAWRYGLSASERDRWQRMIPGAFGLKSASPTGRR